MKRKAKVEDNIYFANRTIKLARENNDTDLQNWALGVYDALNWIIDNYDDSEIAFKLLSKEETNFIVSTTPNNNWDE